MSEQTVVVLGASDKPARFSNMAIKKLISHGHKVIPVHPRLTIIDGVPVVSDMDNIEDAVDTLTLYVGPQRIHALIEKILALRPKRVIFNPGTESAELERNLTEHNIPFVRACTLVMLDAGEF
ncbi:MAG: CoA-binding protein [Gammaproteobacteria bacterium SG8_11]|nr:MAG: CoA-binding protein [Gammaproteobacteria bacterium SG8_11]